MLDRTTINHLRQYPTEWRRRGLTPPADLDAIVTARINQAPPYPVREPAYADFFTA